MSPVCSSAAPELVAATDEEGTAGSTNRVTSFRDLLGDRCVVQAAPAIQKHDLYTVTFRCELFDSFNSNTSGSLHECISA
jgi:hypothetical protein